MKHFYVVLPILFLLNSCKENNNLVEVQLPEPEIETSVVYSNPSDTKTNSGPFQLFKINYPFDALEPSIDGKTMEIHYTKHYLSYTNTLNKLIANNPDWQDKNIEELLLFSNEKNNDLKNNAGGYYNHSLFFEILTPKGAKSPKDNLSKAINTEFTSFNLFKNKFISEANKHFGSGWIWLIVKKEGKLEITTSNNQDNPLMSDFKIKGKPILGIDLWEHAYYLKYQNNRRTYIESVFEIINWTVVSKKYNDIIPTNPQ